MSITRMPSSACTTAQVTEGGTVRPRCRSCGRRPFPTPRRGSTRRPGAVPRRRGAAPLARRPARSTGPRSPRASRWPRPRARSSCASRSSRCRRTSRSPRPRPAGRRAGAVARRADAHVRRRRWRPSTASPCTRRSTRPRPTAASGSTPRSSSRRTATLLARTRKLHIPVTAGYHEDRYFRGGDTGYPVVAMGERRVRVPDVLGPVVPGAGAGVLARRRRGARLPDRDRVGARPSRLRHRAAVGARDPRPTGSPTARSWSR